MTPPTFHPSDMSAFSYAIIQPFISLHYFKTFFLPTGLNADYGWQALESILDPRFFVGCSFIAAMLALALYCLKEKERRPIAFGILWFFLALLPSSSIFPFSEVRDDHRTFFPYVGLMIALASFKYEGLIKARGAVKIGVVSVCVFILGANALGTRRRNRVWRNAGTLWHDVAVKSPRNGRGLMNYGLALMEQGRYAAALAYYEEAEKYYPRYPYLYINLAILDNVLGRDPEAEANFKKAVEFGPDNYLSYYYYARWLTMTGKRNDALPLLVKSIELSPSYMDARHLLLEIYRLQNDPVKIVELARQTLAIDPNDALASSCISPVQRALKLAGSKATPENYIDLSLAYYAEGLYKESVSAAERALKLRPNYAQAYNNIGAAYNAMKMWDKAVAPLKQALRIKPDFELARNNLDWARRQSAASGKHNPKSGSQGAPASR